MYIKLTCESADSCNLDSLESTLVNFFHEEADVEAPEEYCLKLKKLLESSQEGSQIIYEFNLEAEFDEDEFDEIEESLIEFAEYASKLFVTQINYQILDPENDYENSGTFVFGRHLETEDVFMLENGYLPLDCGENFDLSDFNPCENADGYLTVHLNLTLSGMRWLEERDGDEGRVIEDIVGAVGALNEKVVCEPMQFSKCADFICAKLCNNSFLNEVSDISKKVVDMVVHGCEDILLISFSELIKGDREVKAKLHIKAGIKDTEGVGVCIERTVRIFYEFIERIDSCGYQIQMFCVFPMINSESKYLFYSSYSSGHSCDMFGLCEKVSINSNLE